MPKRQLDRLRPHPRLFLPQLTLAQTVIICYITIPSIASFPASARLEGGGLDPRKYDLRTLMSNYSVREVSLTRFGPARRRD